MPSFLLLPEAMTTPPARKAPLEKEESHQLHLDQSSNQANHHHQTWGAKVLRSPSKGRADDETISTTMTSRYTCDVQDMSTVLTDAR